MGGGVGVCVGRRGESELRIFFFSFFFFFCVYACAGSLSRLLLIYSAEHSHATRVTLRPEYVFPVPDQAQHPN